MMNPAEMIAAIVNEIHIYLTTEFVLDSTSPSLIKYKSSDIEVAKNICDLALRLHNIVLNGEPAVVLSPFHKREVTYYNGLLIAAASTLPKNIKDRLIVCVYNGVPFAMNDN
mgnify:FL=1